jgi:threonine dehydrogenase-like Zn-dependent dehydrogenase
VWLARELSLSVGALDVPPPEPGEVRVAVRWAGVGDADLRALRTGQQVRGWPAVLGQEVYGDIDAVGAGVRMALGTPVVLDSRIPCLDCDACRRDPNGCATPSFLGEARPGGFAAYCNVPVWLAHPVPEDLDGSVAVLAVPLAVALHALSHVERPPRQAAIIGHGSIGALIHIELRQAGCAVDVAESAPIRAALAEGLQGIVVERGDLLTENGYDLVVDAVGSSGSLREAIQAAAVGATILAVAVDERPIEILPTQIAQKRLRIIGVNAFVDELPEAIARLAAAPHRYRGVVTDSVGIDQLPVRLARLLETNDAVKLLVHT